ncbi:MAG: response regulator [Ignavibacteriales bacterium]|nr:response regulator [Ignavibacteriales bacterium]
MSYPESQEPLAVLLVEDDPNYVKVVQYQLKKDPSREFHLTWKESVEEALAELKSGSKFDVILTDYSFPTSNGLEFCLQLNEMGNQIPIAFITATRDIKLAIEAMKLGVEDFLLKEDIGESHLARAIANLVERVGLRRQMHAVEKRMSIAENRAQAIRELVVTVCHEFNNPLAAIKISSDLIQRQALSNEDRVLMKQLDKNLERIETEIKRLRDVTFEKIDFHSEEVTRRASPSGNS